ncbi:hypothetical protein [Pedobacter sp. Leaf132]|uniref:hypothetical protein n=1 Tax=Pedobacter sp. Leaf132 TaxID=2876557 RepID=UPI001E2EE0D8|nr:hypothetical protein [Pedobacter sp. Leaf132]
MKTIFDYKPTQEELKELFSYNETERTMTYGFSIIPIDKHHYISIVNAEEALFDIAQLLELRSDSVEARKIWKQIPEIEKQYRAGFDNNIRPV